MRQIFAAESGRNTRLGSGTAHARRSELASRRDAARRSSRAQLGLCARGAADRRRRKRRVGSDLRCLVLGREWTLAGGRNTGAASGAKPPAHSHRSVRGSFWVASRGAERKQIIARIDRCLLDQSASQPVSRGHHENRFFGTVRQFSEARRRDQRNIVHDAGAARFGDQKRHFNAARTLPWRGRGKIGRGHGQGHFVRDRLQPRSFAINAARAFLALEQRGLRRRPLQVSPTTRLNRAVTSRHAHP